MKKQREKATKRTNGYSAQQGLTGFRSHYAPCDRKKKVSLPKRTFAKIVEENKSKLAGKTVVPASLVRQNGKQFCIFPMPHKDLEKVASFRPMTSRDPDGSQRLLSIRHAENFSHAVVDTGSVRMQSVVGALINGAFVAVRKGADLSKNILPAKVVFPSDMGDYLDISDSQHCMHGLETDIVSDKIRNEWVWSVSAALANDAISLKENFSDINGTAKAVPRHVVYRQKYDANRLDPAQMNAADIIIQMNEDSSSVLYHMIKMFTDDLSTRPKIPLIGLHVLSNHLAPIFEIKEVQELSYDDTYALVKEYFNAWSRSKKRVWDNGDDYCMGRATGISAFTKSLHPFLDFQIKNSKPLTPAGLAETVEWVSDQVVDLEFARPKTGFKSSESVARIYAGIAEKLGIDRKAAAQERMAIARKVKAEKHAAKKKKKSPAVTMESSLASE
jgi:hypothetical protein